VKNTLALDIGGTNFRVGIFAGSSLVKSVTLPTNREGGPRWMLNQIEKVVTTLAPHMTFEACGIGFGGPVDFANQCIITSTHVGGWDGFDLISEMKARFNVPAVVDRDSMVGALGEGYFGAGKGYRPLLYITLSTGVGGGLLTENGLFRGADSYACELGHHTILPAGPACLCGSYGCLERMCSGLWIERDYGRPAQELFHDPDFVSRYVVHLAQGLKSSLMFLNPERVVIGGGISEAGDTLFIPLREELDRQMTSWSRARRDIIPAALVGDTVLWGALVLVREHIYRERIA
jgi:glucokinase